MVQRSKPAIRHSGVVLCVLTLLAVSLSGPSLVYRSTFTLVYFAFGLRATQERNAIAVEKI